MPVTDVMIDLETLGTTPDSVIVSIAAVKFDPFEDYQERGVTIRSVAHTQHPGGHRQSD